MEEPLRAHADAVAQFVTAARAFPALQERAAAWARGFTASRRPMTHHLFGRVSPHQTVSLRTVHTAHRARQVAGVAAP